MLFFMKAILLCAVRDAQCKPGNHLKLPIVYLKGTSKTPLTSEQEMYNTPGLMPAVKMTAIYWWSRAVYLMA